MKTENKVAPVEKDRYTVPAVKQAIQVLECLAASETPQMSLLNICSSVGIHKSKAYSILHTLQQSNLVKKIGNKGGYSLGPGLVSLSKRFLDNLDARSLAKPILEKLAKENNCAAVFSVVEEDYVYVAEKAEADHAFSIVASNVGQRFPIDMGSHGVAIASVLSDDEVKKMLSNKRSKFDGAFRRFDDAEFLRRLEYCRKNGYAYDIGFIRPGLNSVASPVVCSRNSVFGYIIVFGLFSEKNVEKIGKMTMQGAKLLSNQLG
jgi:DNA-binding IclR family transcriptional regulator